MVVGKNQDFGLDDARMCTKLVGSIISCDRDFNIEIEELSVQKIEKNSQKWWDEVNHLADLLKQWHVDRQNHGLTKQVQESMEKLGFIVPADKPGTDQ
jgi:hypothetical protein